jgi:mannose-6-phosphate isomerase-like protein (cupin superfamily)
MSKVIKKHFDASDETQSIPKGKREFVSLDGIQVIRNTLEPGWRWSESLGPIMKTDTCQVRHIYYVLSGRLAIRMNDGSSTELGPGEVGLVPPGHDGWVVGDTTCVILDFGGGGIQQ